MLMDRIVENRTVEWFEDSISTLEERWGDLEEKLIHCDGDTDREASITKAMDECEQCIGRYGIALRKKIKGERK